MLRNAKSASKLLACTLLTGAAATTAQANWFASYSGPTSYWAKFTKVPDFDQVRDGLPNNGNMYCVPTSAVNWMAYIARHGYPTIMPGNQTQQYWHSPSTFNLSNIFLNIMGNYMSTDPFDGTYGGPAKDGLDTWLDNRFVVIHRWMNSSETPDFDDIAAFTRLRIPVMACVGWYSDDGLNLSRNGGHCFSVVKVQREGSQRWLTMHDPADEQSNIFTQSAVAERTYEIERRVRIVGGQVRVVDKMLNYGSGYIDTYFAIVPLYGLSTSFDFSDLIIHSPIQFSFDDGPKFKQLPAPGEIVDLVPAPHGPWSAVATKAEDGTHVLWQFDQEEEKFLEIARAELIEQIEFDRFGRIYMADGCRIRCFSQVDDVYEEEAATEAPFPIMEIAFDDTRDLMLAVLEDGTVREYGAGLQEVGGVELPQELILGGKISFDTSPDDGSMFITSEQSPGVYLIHPPDPGRSAPLQWEIIAENQVDAPQSLTVGDRTCLVFVDASCIAQAWCFDQEQGAWVRDPEHPMDGVEVGKNIRMASSRSNYDPEIHSTPDYNNILPKEFVEADPGCLADLNDDNTVDGADLGLLLGAWGGETADLNGDGNTDGADLGLMLGAWGDCPI